MLLTWVREVVRDPHEKVLLELEELGHVEHHDELKREVIERTNLTESEFNKSMEFLYDREWIVAAYVTEDRNFHHARLSKEGSQKANEIPRKEMQIILVLLSTVGLLVTVVFKLFL